MISRDRAATLVVESYDIELTLDARDFRSRTTVRFSCDRQATFADLAAKVVESVTLNGYPLSITEAWDGSRLALHGLGPDNVLEVDAVFPYATEGRGLRRAVDPDGTPYVYGMNYPDASSRVFCCFDDPALRAKTDVTMATPPGWTCLANGTGAPIAPYLVVGAVGPWAELHRWGHADAPLAVYAQRSRSGHADQGREISRLMAGSIAIYERALGVPYPYEKCEAVFVRGLPSLAFSAPGLILFSDTVFDRIETLGPHYAALVVSHEVAHAWIGGLVDCHAPWLAEACSTYLARNALAELMPGSRPWEPADPPPPDAAYTPDAELIKSLEKRIGRAGVAHGLGLFCRRFHHGIAGRAELAACWSETSGHDLTGWAASTGAGRISI